MEAEKEEQDKHEKGLTIEKLKLLTGRNDLQDREAEEIILSIRTLVEILLHYQEAQENESKDKVDNNITNKKVA